MWTLDILELAGGQGRSMAPHEIASALAIPVSSLAYLLTTLVDAGALRAASMPRSRPAPPNSSPAPPPS